MEPKFLYHYTSIQTLYNLLNTLSSMGDPADAAKDTRFLTFFKLKFWASHISYMNDPTENLFYIKSLVKALEKYEISNNLERKSCYLEGLKTSLNSHLSQPYILSLCDNDSSLSMWRSYGANGCGVAIGLSFSALNEFIAEEKHLFLSEMTYENENELIEKMPETLLKSIWDGITFQEKKAELDERLTAELTPPKTYIKPKVYFDEKEWRISSNKPNCTKFREKNGLIIPYVEINLPIKLIKQIVIGPCANQEMSAQSIAMMISSKFNSLCDIDIRKSNLPYVIR